MTVTIPFSRAKLPQTKSKVTTVFFLNLMMASVKKGLNRNHDGSSGCVEDQGEGGGRGGHIGPR